MQPIPHQQENLILFSQNSHYFFIPFGCFMLHYKQRGKAYVFSQSLAQTISTKEYVSC